MSLNDVDPALAVLGTVSPTFAAPAILASTSVGGRVRPLARSDLPAVAALFLKTFRRSKGAAPEQVIGDVADYMRQLYLEGPACDEGRNCLVHVDRGGTIGGFLGALCSTYLLDGRPLRTAVASALMAADQVGHRRAGPELMRSFVNGPGDLFITDSANRTSLAFAKPMKYELSLLNSLEWSRPFRPAALLVEMVRHRWPMTPSALMAPFARVADLAAGRMLRARRTRSVSRRWQGESIDATAFARLAPRFLGEFRLRPAWSERELDWLLMQAAQQRTSGPLHFRALTDQGGTAIGCFAFYGAPGRPAIVLQMLAGEGHWDSLVDCVMQTTEAMGCLGVRGAVQPRILPRLYAYPDLVFYHAGATMVSSPDAAVLDAVRAEGALLGGLAGDRWTRLSKGEFGSRPSSRSAPSPR